MRQGHRVDRSRSPYSASLDLLSLASPCGLRNLGKLSKVWIWITKCQAHRDKLFQQLHLTCEEQEAPSCRLGASTIPWPCARLACPCTSCGSHCPLGHTHLAQQPGQDTSAPYTREEGPPLWLPSHLRVPCTATAVLTFQLLLGVTVRLTVLICH